MRTLWKIATPVACVAVISGAAILWWVHKQKAIERKKFGEAASISRVGAEQGDARAQFEFGYTYFKGKGVPQDYAEAIRWYRALKTRLSTPSKVLITIEFLGTILLLVSSYRSAGGAFGPQQRTAIVKELLGLSYLVLVCMGLFQMGVAQTNAFRFTKNLLAGMVLAMLISVIWQQSAKSVLRISGMLFVAFNLYAIAHYDVKHFAPAIRMFYLTNALLIGMAIPSAAAVWLAAKTYQEGQSRSGQAAPSQT